MWINRHKTLVTAMGIALITVVLFLIAIVPIYNNAGSILVKIKTKSKELDSLTTKVAILSKLDANVLKERVEVLDAALPPRKDVLLYLTSIDGLSKELGLTFGGLSLSPGDITEATGSAAKRTVKVGGGVQSLETQIKMSGGQDSIYSFLRTVETVLPLMQIQDIKVSILEDNQFALSLTLAMLWAEPATMDVKGPVTLFGAEEDKYFSQLLEYRRFDTAGITSTVQTGKSNIFAPPTGETIKPQQ
ncbi:MAG: hypothetical protein WCG44_03905 [bacterium]